jgi:DNA-directed RNA polymerase sigma subunit (sigma70/sigma32)
MDTDSIIDRLRRNARKQKEYRHIVRGRSRLTSYENARRQADIYFLRTYTDMTLKAIGNLTNRSAERVRQIGGKRDRAFEFTVCHPSKSCM